MEENRRISWSSLFMKVILVIIFILFTVWLLSLSNKDLIGSLDVLKNNIFSQNMEKMKEVGKEYFTTERLPKKIGEIETLTLEEMYEKKLILELVDKNGNACDAEDSYVSVEKMENEYQMKVNLECDDREEFIIVIMGCYDYCETDICEKVEVKEESSNKKIEYQYVKTTGGYWTDYGNWSDWSKVSVTNTDYRQVETKKVTEEYTYDKKVSKNEYVEFNETCPSGYKKTADGTKCYKIVTSSDTASPVCPSVDGYTNTGRSGFTCNYSKDSAETTSKTATCPTGYTKSGNDCIKSTTTTTTKTATCPTGYSKSGNSCVKTTSDSKNPTCPSVDGYTNTGRDGFTCNYSKTTSDTKNPTCPSVSGYVMTNRNGFTCNYSKWVKGDYVKTDTGERVPGNTNSYIYEEVGSAEYVYDCENSCAFRWIHTWKVYKAKNLTTTKTATCPSGYTKSGSTCAKSTTDTTTKTATCPSGYSKSGNSCVKTSSDSKNPTCPSVSGYTNTGRSGFTCNYSKTTSDSKNPTCPSVSGYTNTGRSGFTCNYSKPTVVNKTQSAVCPNGYSKSGNSCVKTVTDYEYKSLLLTCPSGYNKTTDGNKCFKVVESTVVETGTKEVTYYRYRVREYKGGSSDYKWSASKNDKSLLNAGYKLTGKTR